MLALHNYPPCGCGRFRHDECKRVPPSSRRGRRGAASVSAGGFAFGRRSGAARRAGAWGLAGVFTAPISNGFSVLGKLGLVRSELKTSASGVNFRAHQKESSTGVNFGFGAKYDFAPNLAVRAEWERLNKFENRVDELRTNIDFLSTGITFKF